MNTNKEKSVRDKYFGNEIFKIGDIVEDVTTLEQVKIIDRGSNYVTVATSTGILKKWLNEVVENKIEENSMNNSTPDFTITESGQIKLFGYETKNFDSDLSEFVLEQFTEFDDLYSKHQIVKCLDMSIQENNLDRAYALAEKVESFYSKYEIDPPIIVEAIKSDIERRRIVDILASIADIESSKSYHETVSNAIKALKSKYKLRNQWEIIYPFFKIADEYGLTGIIQKLPFDFSTDESYEDEDRITLMALEENFDLLLEDLDVDDIEDAFCNEEESDEYLVEVLSLETRNKLSRKLTQRSPMLTVKRERALQKAASSTVLLARARKLAETMIKRRMFHKSPDVLTRQEKERFESGASRRRELVARLAQKLLPKVRQLQSQRLHHEKAPSSHTHDIATAKIAMASNQSNSGAS